MAVDVDERLPADPRGHGNWRVFRDDLIRFVENFAAEAGGPVLLGGHSMGGTTSLMVAAERPDLVRGLILVDPVMVPLSARLVMKAYRALGRKGGPASLAEGAERRRAVFPDRATMVTAYKGRGAFRTWPEEVIADYVEGGTKLREDGKYAVLHTAIVRWMLLRATVYAASLAQSYANHVAQWSCAGTAIRTFGGWLTGDPAWCGT